MGFRTLPKKLKEFQALYNLVIAHYGQNKNVSKKQKKVIKKIKDALDSFPESNEKTIDEQKRLRKQIRKEMKRIEQDYCC